MKRIVWVALYLLSITSIANAQVTAEVDTAALLKGFEVPTPEQLAKIQGPPRMAIYFDLGARSRSIAAAPGVPFEFSVVAVGCTGGIKAWEARVVLDDRISVISRHADGLNLGRPDQWRVALEKRCKADQDVVLATYTAQVKEGGGNDLILGLAPVEGGSFHPPAPGYLECGTLHGLRACAWSDTTAVVNPEKVRLAAEKPAGSPDFQMKRGGDAH